MSAYGVYQIFLASTAILRMAPQGRRERQMMKEEMLVTDDKSLYIHNNRQSRSQLSTKNLDMKSVKHCHRRH